jgi:hypothetical protein
MAGMHKPLMRSFAGGEITPELYGRIDLDKMQTGLARALNFIVLPHGPAANRSGFSYVLEARRNDTVRLIPFSYSVDQTMVLEFTELKVRFHTAGATLLETAQVLTTLTQANPGVFTINAHGWSNGDTVFSTAVSDTWALYGRFLIVQNVTANTFTLTDLAGNAIDTTSIPMPLYNTTFARVYEVTTPYGASVLRDLHYTQSADVLTITHPNFEPRELRRLGATNWSLDVIDFEPGMATPAIPTGAADTSGGAGTPIDHVYVTTAISGDNFEESLASPTLTLSNDLTVSGNKNEVTPAAVAGAIRYNVYKLANGGLYGYIGQSDGTMFEDDNIIPDMSQTPPEANDPFAAPGDYPSTVTYMEQRRCFAATDNRPQHIWMTRSATESNMTQSVPVRDNDAIIFRIAASQQNRVRHLVPLGDLIAITAGGEFRIYASGSEALTPSSVTPKPQSYVGANNVQPAVAENSVLYVQGQGGHIREFVFAGDGINGALYKTNDVSILAPHLFDGYDIVDLAYSRTAKCPTLWAVRSDGQLLGMTYVPGQMVRAWHQHDTDGAFESVCCVTEGGEDVLYAAIRREIDGRDVVYVERLHTRQFGDLEDAFFVDSGLTYDGTPTTTVSGLWHLIGKTVSILADGAVCPQQVVGDDGALPDPLPAACSKIHVGLPITSNLKTLPLSWQADGFGQGLIKNVSKAHVRLVDSSQVSIGPADGNLVPIRQRTTEPYGSPPAMMNGWKHVNIAPQWDDDGAIEIEQTDPLPVTVVALVLDVVSGG